MSKTSAVIEKIKHKYSVGSAAFTCFLGIALFFVFSSNLSNMVGKFLRVSPSYTGGEISGDFIDSIGDDFGAGKALSLAYPLNPCFTEGSLDLIRYTVHQPVTNAKWQNSADYWQLVLEYKSGAASVRNIMIYIDADNIQGGSLEPLFPEAEKISFAPDHPWDFALQVFGDKAKIYDSDGKFITDLECYSLQKHSQIKIRIPLADKRLQRILGAKTTCHYVLTGASSQFDAGNLMPVEDTAALSRGGLKNKEAYNSLIPPFYDVLGENDSLGAWNNEDYSYAEIQPVEASMKSHKRNKENEAEISEFINQLKQEYYESRTSSTARENAIKDIEGTLSYFRRKLDANPDDYMSLSYYGSMLAMKGGQSSVLKAMAMVNEAYEYLDKAAELSRGKEGELEVLMNRASVSAAVPDAVFAKAESGANDFIRIASITGDKKLKAYCYAMAYECYKKCDNESLAFIALQEARRLKTD